MLMYLKKESGYGFAPAIVEMLEKRTFGGKVQIIFTNNDLWGFAYSQPFHVLSKDIRKPTLLELLKVPLKSYIKYFVKKRKTK